MGKRRRGGIEDLIEVLSLLPWWACVLIAVGSYFALNALTSPGAATPATLNDLSAHIGAQMLRTAAGIGQYVVPLVALIAAAASVIKRRQRRKLLADADSLASIDRMTWRQFELLVGEWFRTQGYSVRELGGAGADGGVDLVVTKDGHRHLVQCKQWKAAKVSVGVVRELYGVMAAERADGGYVITSGRFTGDAQRFAAGKNIVLIDGPRLTAIIRATEPNLAATNSGPSSAPQVTPDTPRGHEPVLCPRCGGGMLKRIAKQGQQAGTAFWGCARFPQCRGTISIDRA